MARGAAPPGTLAGWAPGSLRGLDAGRFDFRQPPGAGFVFVDRSAEEWRQIEADRSKLEQVWKRWVRKLFPGHVSDDDGDFVPFAPHHTRYWTHLWSIERGVRPQPALFGFSRGHAKSTGMELGAAALGARGIRDYGLYVCGVQDQANEHVGNIQDAIEESEELARLYPMMAKRGVNVYGHSEGWSHTRLVTASGFAVDALGLDTAAARGKKFKMRRPGFIGRAGYTGGSRPDLLRLG